MQYVTNQLSHPDQCQMSTAAQYCHRHELRLAEGCTLTSSAALLWFSRAWFADSWRGRCVTFPPAQLALMIMLTHTGLIICISTIGRFHTNHARRELRWS